MMYASDTNTNKRQALHHCPSFQLFVVVVKFYQNIKAWRPGYKFPSNVLERLKPEARQSTPAIKRI